MLIRGRHKYKKDGIAHLWRRNPSNAIRLLSLCGQCDYLVPEVIEDKEVRLCKHCETKVTRP